MFDSTNTTRGVLRSFDHAVGGGAERRHRNSDWNETMTRARIRAAAWQDRILLEAKCCNRCANVTPALWER
jgi:hypothetical protein